MKIFEYAIVYHPQPTKEDVELARVPKSVLVKPVTQVLANSEKDVGIVAAREISADLLDKLDRVEIAVRPF